jgi:hypothetical protein
LLLFLSHNLFSLLLFNISKFLSLNQLFFLFKSLNLKFCFLFYVKPILFVITFFVLLWTLCFSFIGWCIWLFFYFGIGKLFFVWWLLSLYCWLFQGFCGYFLLWQVFLKLFHMLSCGTLIIEILIILLCFVRDVILVLIVISIIRSLFWIIFSLFLKIISLLVCWIYLLSYLSKSLILPHLCFGGLRVFRNLAVFLFL